jgi:DnaJ-class molecular chaperone
MSGDVQFNGTPEEWDALVEKSRQKKLIIEIMQSDEEDDICPVCNGTGEGPADGTTCWKCKGR